ncbi:protein of unknown function [Candidatus Nitrosocosmicus franklandus]|uniref:Uncharacterized protein n=1 Tax=Candidatus Nitrosocosmicus franklandianus TaxID=1798806 RepID=A0A484I6B1_9ARCH|nr:protein of unknown function [Candidatus Nitrosocosmicus franklandus]
MSGITFAVVGLFVTDRETDIDPNLDSFSDMAMKYPLSKLRILSMNFLPREFENISMGLEVDIIYNVRQSYYC